MHSSFKKEKTRIDRIRKVNSISNNLKQNKMYEKKNKEKKKLNIKMLNKFKSIHDCPNPERSMSP